MDYSKLPLAKRTRRQEELFFQQYYKEKKRENEVEKQKASEHVGRDDVVERMREGSERVEERNKEDEENGSGSIDGMGKGEMGEVGLKRRRRGKSPEVVFLGVSGGDDGVGFERRQEESPEVVFLRQERVDGGEGFVVVGEGEEVTMRNRKRGRPHGKLSSSLGSGGLRRKKYCGLDILVGEVEESEGKSVAERLRSRSRSRSQCGEKKELGSFRNKEVVFLRQERVDGREGFVVEGDREEVTMRKRGRGRPHGSLSSSLVGGEKDGSGGLMRKKYCGLDILVGEVEESGGKSVAERLRSRSRCGEKKELGSFSRPFRLSDEDEELESSSVREDEGLKSVAERLRSRSGRGEKKELGSFSSRFGLTDEGEELESCSVGEDEGLKSVAERLRSRSRRGEKMELGSFSSHFVLTDKDEELESSSVGEDEDEVLVSSSSGEKNRGKVGGLQGKRCGHGNSASDAKAVGKSQEKAKGKMGRPAKRMRPTDVEKILADSILEKSGVLAEELVSLKVADVEPTLLLKFRFLDEDPVTPEKSPWDAEVDKLFAEMDFALAACSIGDSDSSMVDNEDHFTEETESDPTTSCQHQLVIDEQIGYKCTFCSCVKLEIKHISPSFVEHPLGRPDKNYRNNSDHFNFDKFQFQHSASTPNFKDHNLAGGTVCDLISALNPSLYEHQQEGFEFIWKNIGGSISLEELKKTACNGGSGCIISHAPGTGKTRLAIVFLQTFMEFDPECRPVIVAPKGMLLTWEEEFKKWFDVPFHNLNRREVTGRESEAALNLLNSEGTNVNRIRLVKLYSWTMGKSVLGISYRLFEKLAEDGIVPANDEGGSKTKRKSKRNAVAEKVRKVLLEHPGLLVLDEGHTPRNKESLMWRALSGVKTQRRILLSGTPFQNNFDELFNTLSLVRPKFLDKITGIKGDSRRNRGRKGTKSRGKWASLTNSIGKDAGNKLDKLRAIIEPFVHVHEGRILEEKLPGLLDAIVVLNPTDLQKSLVEVIQGQNTFKREHLATLISVHPSLLLGHALSDEEGLSVDTNELETLRFDPKAGVKTNFLMELIRLSMAAKEKVLVFSQYIQPLKLIRKQLKKCFGWAEGKDLLYMDGKIKASKRQSSISLLNDSDSQVHVLLASIRACSEGIHLVGASRVVLLDVAWNPSVESQAISRAYRIGQKKVVYVYRLILSGAMEVEKRARQAEKDRLSELVFSSADGKLQGKETISCAVDDDKILQEMVQHEKISHIFEKATVKHRSSLSSLCSK